MSEKPSFRRRRYFIDKKFQTSFTVSFLIIIALAAIAGLALFLFNARGTLTAGYTGAEVRLLHTSDFFLPTLLVSTGAIIIVSGAVGAIVMILISHRIAGPLYRFEMILKELYKGDLTLRFKLRQKDQFTELADRINSLTETMNGKVGSMKAETAEISRLVSGLQTVSASHPVIELERPLREITERLAVLENAANYFKTSGQK